MKRILYILLASLTFVGCQKGEDNLFPNDAEAVNFSAGVLTRSEMKTAWEVGKQIAIFECDGDTPSSTSAPLVYKITDESGELEAVDNCYYATDTETTKFIAIYPYMVGYSYASYVAAMGKNFSDYDILMASSTMDDNRVVLQFNHIFARLEFNITNFTGSSATLQLDDVPILNRALL